METEQELEKEEERETTRGLRLDTSSPSAQLPQQEEPQQELTQEQKMQNAFEEQFLYAAKNNHLERAERLLLDGNYDPSYDDNAILQWACENGYAQVVKVLLRDKRVDVNCKGDLCMHLVCEFGQLEVLEVLLADGRSNPACENSLALWLACQNGHPNIVQRLMNDGRVNINDKNEEMTCLEVAVLHEHYELAQIMLHSTSNRGEASDPPKRTVTATSRRSIDMGSSPAMKLRGKESHATMVNGNGGPMSPRSPTSPSSSSDPASSSSGDSSPAKSTKEKPFKSALNEIRENVGQEGGGGSPQGSFKDTPKPHVKDIVSLEIERELSVGKEGNHAAAAAALLAVTSLETEGEDDQMASSTLKVSNAKKPKRGKTSGSFESIPEENDEIMKKQQISIEACQKELLDIVRKRKQCLAGQFAIDLKALQDINVSPLSFGFNQALTSLLISSKTSGKKSGRGTCQSYTQDLLNFAEPFRDLVVEESTILAFRQHWSPFMSKIRTFFNLRNREDPTETLKGFRKNLPTAGS